MLIERAKLFATKAHYGQVRKYTGEPYITHPAEVVDILMKIPHTPTILSAGWLHDTVEDTEVSLETIFQDFGSYIGELVFWMTDPVSEANRATRKAAIRERWKMAPSVARTIKLADTISNTKTIAQRDPTFAKVYFGEIALLLPILAEGGDVTLHAVAKSQIEAFSKEV